MKKSSIRHLKFDSISDEFNHKQKLKKNCRLGFSSITLFFSAFLLDGKTPVVIHADTNSSNQSMASSADTYDSSSDSNFATATEQSSSESLDGINNSSIEAFSSSTSSNISIETSDKNLWNSSNVDSDSLTSDEQDNVSTFQFDSPNRISFSSHFNSSPLDMSGSYDDSYVPQAVASTSLMNVSLIPVYINPPKTNAISLQNSKKWFDLLNPYVYSIKAVKLIENLQGQKNKLFAKLQSTQNLAVKIKTYLKNSSDANAIFHNLSMYNDLIRQSKECNNQIKKLNNQIHDLQK